MSSARLPLALAVIGLAACAHTQQPESALSIANARHAAPIIVVDAEQVPEGYDEHVVMMIDPEGLERARRQEALLDPNSTAASRYYGYRIYTPDRPYSPGYPSGARSDTRIDPVDSSPARGSGVFRSQTEAPRDEFDRGSLP